MRILHLTDFHYQKVPKYDYDQTKVVEAIVNSIENKNIDYIFLREILLMMAVLHLLFRS